MHPNQLYFVPYSCPPRWDEDETTKQMWLESAHLTYDDLALALRFANEPFWALVATNTSFVECLESYLRFGPRPFDLEHVDAGKTEEIISIQQGIHRSVFLLFGRLATFRRCNMNGKTNDDLLSLLVAKKVFEPGNILDLCSVYYEGNAHRLTKLLELILAEEQLAGTLKKVVDFLPNVFNDLADELGVALGAAALPKLDGALKDVITEDKLVDVIVFLADVASSLLAVCELHRPSAELMHKRGMEITLAAMYEAVYPVLSQELRNVAERETRQNLKALELRINWGRETFIKLVRRLIVVNCIDPLWDRSGEFKGKTCPLADDFFQILSSCANEQLFAADYLAYFPLADDLDVYEQTGVKTDETMKQYVVDSLEKLSRGGSQTQVRRSPSRLPALEAITENGARSPPAPCSSPINAWEARRMRKKPVVGAKLESLISKVTDLLSDLGKGFVHACLEHFDYDTEATINGILEDNLPHELALMNRKAEVYYPAGDDGGNDADAGFEEPLDPELLALKSIHKGKKEKLDEVLKKKPELSAAEKDRYWHYGNATEFLPNMRIAEAYDDEDEYDDTYDAEPEFRPEGASGLLEEKSNSPVPAFAVAPLNDRKSAGQKKWSLSDEEEGLDEEEQKRRRDAFCENPEEVRRRYEMSRGARGHRGGGASVRGAPRGTGQDEATLRSRRRKEENKAAAGNHNRRSQAQWKRRPF